MIARTAAMFALATLGAVSCARSVHETAPNVEPISERSAAAQPQTSEAPRSPSQSAVPESLRAACGHPKAQATLAAVPVTVAHNQCDLTGVVVLYGQTGVTVPSAGGVQAFADFTWGASELSANIDPITGDVTFR